MTKLTTLAAVGAALLVACETEPAETVFENGDRFEFQEDAPGPTAGPGDIMRLYVDVYNADSLLSRAPDSERRLETVVLPPADSAAEANNSILRAFRLLSAGDSATLYRAIDSLQRLPPGLDRAAGLRYVFSVESVGDSLEAAAYQEELEAERLAYSGRLGVVQDSVETLLEEYRRLGADGAGFNTTASGLMYKILEPGTGPQPDPGDAVFVSYYGALTEDGSSFDDSFRRGEAFAFPLGAGQVIPGWDEGIALLNEGARAILVIPSELGYGARGSGPNIPPDSELAFYVQLEDIQ